MCAWLPKPEGARYICVTQETIATHPLPNASKTFACEWMCEILHIHTFAHIFPHKCKRNFCSHITRGKANSIPLENNPWNYGGITIAENMSLLLDKFFMFASLCTIVLMNFSHSCFLCIVYGLSIRNHKVCTLKNNTKLLVGLFMTISGHFFPMYIIIFHKNWVLTVILRG